MITFTQFKLLSSILGKSECFPSGFIQPTAAAAVASLLLRQQLANVATITFILTFNI